MNKSPLGEKSELPDKYDPEILFPIPRWPSRSLLDIDKKIPLHGFDYWHAYELSWLNSNRKPEVGIGKFFFDASSENMVESKSVKLYLHSLSNECFKHSQEIAAVVAKDLTVVTRSEVIVVINKLSDGESVTLARPPGKCIDGLDIKVSSNIPDATLLKSASNKVASVRLFSDLFRSRCPITGQPDWATFTVEYSGLEIDEGSLLAYVCSFRNHQSYHEGCAELMFRDIMVQCEPDKLIVGLNYTRRGGLDINPFRSNNPISPEHLTFRLERQ